MSHWFSKSLSAVLLSATVASAQSMPLGVESDGSTSYCGVIGSLGTLSPSCPIGDFRGLTIGAVAGWNVPAGGDVTSCLTPAGSVRIITEAGIGFTAGHGNWESTAPVVHVETDYKLQKDHVWPAGSGYWLQPIASTPVGRWSTPVLGWTGELVLRANERLSARAGIVAPNAQMYVMYSGYEIPASCLAEWLK